MDGKDDSGIDCEVTEQSKIAAAVDTNHINDNNEDKCEEIIPQKVISFQLTSFYDFSRRTTIFESECHRKITRRLIKQIFEKVC